MAYSRHEHGKLNNIISISDVGKDSPTAFDPNKIEWDVGNKDWIKNLTL